eukprot:Hpha_TRINITY_DN16208_c1_g3::TRINITY_DN16208_c1_g3_i1::g.15381::m.15381/K12580/CNOT3, NOT3; CCR4-NOT transcription complex subunit 3
MPKSATGEGGAAGAAAGGGGAARGSRPGSASRAGGSSAGGSRPKAPDPAVADDGEVREVAWEGAQELHEAMTYDPPQPSDSERPVYVPPNPYKTPSYYPQDPYPVFRKPELFASLVEDTLFFAFYYQQSTYQQYLAARALKARSWRYHTKFLMWFQRADRPHATTADYEKGRYKYFDYDDWEVKEYQDFCFEYQYLENDVPPASVASASGSGASGG